MIYLYLGTCHAQTVASVPYFPTSYAIDLISVNHIIYLAVEKK